MASIREQLLKSLDDLKQTNIAINEFNDIQNKSLNEINNKLSKQYEIRYKILENETSFVRQLAKGRTIIKNSAKAAKEVATNRRLIRNEEKNIAKLTKHVEKLRKAGNDSQANALQEDIAKRKVANVLQKNQNDALASGIPIIGKLGAGMVGIIGSSLKIASVIQAGILAPFKILGKLLKDTWKNFLEIQTRSGGIAADLGLSADRARDLRNNFASLTLASSRFGADMSFVEDTIRKISDITNRNLLPDVKDISKLAEIAKATGLGAEGAATMYGNFELINMSISDTGDYIEQVRKRTTRMNLNVTKSLQKINDLFDDIKGLSFKGGLDSLTKLVTKAESLRYNLTNIGGLADQLMSPEGAINLASNLKVLGGSFASLADPMNLMYQAQYDQAGLFEQILESTKNIATVTKDGLVQISPAQRMVLNEVAQLTGQSADQLYNAALQGGRLKQLISQGGLRMFSTEDQEALLNLAEFEDGKFYLTMPEGDRKAIESMKGDRAAFKAILDNQKLNKDAAMGRLDLARRFGIMKQQLILALDPVFKSVNALFDDSGLMRSINNSVQRLAEFLKNFLSKYFSKGSKLYSFMFNLGDKLEGVFSKFEQAVDLAQAQGKGLFSLFKDEMFSLGKNLIIQSAPYFKAGFGILLNEINKTLIGGALVPNSTIKSLLGDEDAAKVAKNIGYEYVNDGIYDKGMLVKSPKGTYKLNKADQFIAGTNLMGNGGGNNGVINLNISGELIVKSTDTSVKLGKGELTDIGIKALASMVEDQIEKNKQGTYKENRNGRVIVKSI